MARSDSVRKFATYLAQAIEDKNVEQIDAARERLLELLLDSIHAQSTQDLEVIEVALGGSFSRMVLAHGVSPRRTLESTAWMMKAESRLATLALRCWPSVGPPLTDDSRPVRERIIRELAHGNGRALSNKELAEKCGANTSTIARLMPGLRTEGLVRTEKRGARKINKITEAGRAAAASPRAGGDPVLRTENTFDPWLHVLLRSPMPAATKIFNRDQLLSNPTLRNSNIGDHGEFYLKAGEIIGMSDTEAAPPADELKLKHPVLEEKNSNSRARKISDYVRRQ